MERPGRGRQVLLAVTSVVFLALGASMLWYGLAGGSGAGVAVMGALFAALAVTGLLVLTATPARTRILAEPTGGVRVTSAPERGRPPAQWAGAVTLVVIGVWLVAFLPVAAPVALWIAAVGLVPLTPWFGRGDLLITPTGIGQHTGGWRQWVDWDAVADVDFLPAGGAISIRLAARPDAAPLVTATLPPLLRVFRRPPPGMVLLTTGTSDISRVGLALLAQTLVSQPAVRAELTGPDAVAGVEQFLRG